MTIALGLVASDGLVIAADTQETMGSTKIHRCKVSEILAASAFAGDGDSGYRCCVITGSGDALHIDAVARLIIKSVSANENQSPEVIQAEFCKVFSDYYNAHIAPFASFPENIRPDLHLIIGFGKRLLVSANDALSETMRPFVSVGMGWTVAEPLFTNFYQSPAPDLRSAILLAAYVMFQVKDAVDYCGKSTSISGLRQDGNYFEVRDEDATALEAAISNYRADVEPTLLRSLTGIATDVQRKKSAKATAKLKKIVAKIKLC